MRSITDGGQHVENLFFFSSAAAQAPSRGAAQWITHHTLFAVCHAWEPRTAGCWSEYVLFLEDLTEFE